MLKNLILLISITLFISSVAISAKDTITEIKLKVSPATAKIRPLQTAIITTEFYGTKKKSFLGTLLGNTEGKKTKLQSNKWTVSLSGENSGWVSKPFLFQKEGEKTKSGFGNFIRQGLRAASSKDSILYTAPAEPGKYRLKFVEGNLSKEITIEVSASAPSSKKAETTSFKQKPKSTSKYFFLAEHYAPFIAQETWFNPKGDYLVRFDSDGNWKGDDNWENLETSSSQAYVYYTAMETKTHWFLIYNFFHARDYSDVCIIGTCHENDNEGLILTIRKDESKHGKLEVMETLAHNNIYSFTNLNKIKKGVHKIDGGITFHKDTRPVVFLEAGGHGVYGNDYKKSLFSSRSMTFKGNTGVTYIYKGRAERPKHPNDRNVGYALLPIYEEWWSRGTQTTEDENETFGKFYTYQPFGNRPKAKAAFISKTFKGRTASDDQAKPFWAWHDKRTKKKKVLNTGQWALDPAYAISKNLKFPKNKPVSTEYVFNPYLQLEIP